MIMVANFPGNYWNLLECSLPPGKCKSSWKTPGTQFFEPQLAFDSSTAHDWHGCFWQFSREYTSEKIFLETSPQSPFSSTTPTYSPGDLAARHLPLLLYIAGSMLNWIRSQTIMKHVISIEEQSGSVINSRRTPWKLLDDSRNSLQNLSGHPDEAPYRAI